MMEKDLKGYMWKDCDDNEYGWAVVACSVKEAKKIGWDYNASECGNDCEWTEIDCHWVKSSNVKGLPIGVITDFKLGLKSGIYGFVEGEICENCKEENTLHLVNGKCICFDCEDKLNEVTPNSSQ